MVFMGKHTLFLFLWTVVHIVFQNTVGTGKGCIIPEWLSISQSLSNRPVSHATALFSTKLADFICATDRTRVAPIAVEACSFQIYLCSQELLSRTSLETQKLDLMTEVSELKLKLVGMEKEQREQEDKQRKAEVSEYDAPKIREHKQS